MKHCLTVVLVLASLLAYSQTEDHPDGEIKGTVTDEDGIPVAAATVYAVPQDISFDGITPRSVKTDRNGEFDFHGGFPLGAYKLYPRKDEDLYPDPLDKFYADSKAQAPKVGLTEGDHFATIEVKMGEKAGVISGRVIDEDSGANARALIDFIDEDGNRRSISVNGKYRMLLPPGKDVTLMVIALSAVDRPQLPVAPLRLEPGQEMHMDIPLSNQ